MESGQMPLAYDRRNGI